MSADQMKSSMRYVIYGLSAVSLPFFIFMPSVSFCITHFYKFENLFCFIELRALWLMYAQPMHFH